MAAGGAAPDRMRPVFIQGGGAGMPRKWLCVLAVVAVALLIVAVFT